MEAVDTQQMGENRAHTGLDIIMNGSSSAAAAAAAVPFPHTHTETPCLNEVLLHPIDCAVNEL